MPTFAELRAKAEKAATSAKTGAQNTRDRYSSTPTARTSFDYNQPPPARTSIDYSNRRSIDRTPQQSVDLSHDDTPPRYTTSSNPVSPGPPPPVASRSRPGVQTAQSGPSPPPISYHSRPKESPSFGYRIEDEQGAVMTADRIDWSNLSEDDKQTFFAWLDEFFARYTGGKVPIRPRPVSTHSPSPIRQPPPPSRGAPPPIASRTRPAQCSAEELARYFAPTTSWDSDDDAPWYTQSQYPPLLSLSDTFIQSGYQQYGPNNKTIFACVFFVDLSICWYTVTFNPSTPSSPPRERSAHWRLPPNTMDRAALLAAHETYGETVAIFAETYADANSACQGSGFLGREAIEYFKQFDYMPPPCPSLWYKHGHLIFSSKKGSGVWRGGDTCLRRGDVIQLMNARMPYENGYVFMPMQDAIVTRDSEPLGSHVADGHEARLGEIQVVEQRVGDIARRTTYDFGDMSVEEVYVYRVVGMEEYLGTSIEVRMPEGVDVFSV